MSLPAPLKDEPNFHLRFADLVMIRVRRSLRACFEYLFCELRILRLSKGTIDGGGLAGIIHQFRPDTAFIVVGANQSTRGLEGFMEVKILNAVFARSRGPTQV
jgi:hypothetical protein